MITCKLLVRVLCVSVLILLSAGPAASADCSAPRENEPAKGGISTARFLAALEKRGFEVSRGDFQLWGVEDCPDSYPVMQSCFFNNPTAPYVIPIVPYWPDEHVDPATQGVFGATPPGTGTAFRFDPNEAIVIFGVLPPKAAYFGIQTYLFTRKGTYQTNNPTYEFLHSIGAQDLFFQTVPGNPARIGSFASLSNSNNNVVIERRSGAAFGRFRYFIITPNRFMDKQVRQALHRLKVPDKDVFSEAIPSNMNLGLGPDADDFVTLIRYARPLDGGGEGSPSDGWRHNPPLTVLRVRDTRPHRPPQLYPAWVDNSPERRTAVDERGLKASLTQLVKQVSERWGQPCGQDDCADRALSFIDVQSYPMNLVGPLCDNIGMDCLGDTQDATYQFRPGLSFDNGEVYAVAGTLGTVTGNATYVSLAVNNTHLRLGAVNVNGDELRGSAASYSVADNPDKFYVYYFTRDCTGLETLTSGHCTSIADTELGVPAGVAASFVERDYIRVGTQRGPDSKLLLPSVVLKLQRPAH